MGSKLNTLGMLALAAGLRFRMNTSMPVNLCMTTPTLISEGIRLGKCGLVNPLNPTWVRRKRVRNNVKSRKMDVKDINLDDYEISQQAGEEIIILRKKNHKHPKWEDLNRISGCYIAENCIIRPASNIMANGENKNVFLTEKHAKSALAMAQISQLIPFYGGEITDEEWKDSDMKKYVITRDGNEIRSVANYTRHEFLAFHTSEQRNVFLKNNEQLVKDYLMIE